MASARAPTKGSKHGGSRKVLCWQDKLALCEEDTILEFISTAECGNKCKCFDKLRAMRQETCVQVVRDLRERRISGKCIFFAATSGHVANRSLPRYKLQFFTPGVQKQRKSWLRPLHQTCLTCPCVTITCLNVPLTSVTYGSLFEGGFTQETSWVFSELTKFAVCRGAGVKPVFKYSLPDVGDVCRCCWILAAGGAYVVSVVLALAYYINV